MKVSQEQVDKIRAKVLAGDIPDWVIGFKTLLMGQPGSGKTTAVVTLLKMGFKVYVAFTEAGVGALNKALTVHKVSEEDRKRLFFAYIKPGVENFTVMKKGAKAVNEAAEFGKMESGSRKDFNQLIQLMQLFENFKDQNGVEHGPVDAFKCDSVLALDGLTGLSKMAMDLVVGAKPAKTLQDWGVAIDQLDKFQLQCANIVCPFVMLAHLSREQEEISGKIIVTLSTLGRQLGPRMPSAYNDFVYAKQDGDGKWFWSTIDKNCQLKATYLEHAERLPADFVPLVVGWATEQGFI